jgi:hypothetical protein
MHCASLGSAQQWISHGGWTVAWMNRKGARGSAATFDDAARAAAELGQEANLLSEQVRLRLRAGADHPDDNPHGSGDALDGLAAELSSTAARLREQAFQLSRALDASPLPAVDPKQLTLGPETRPPMRRFTPEQRVEPGPARSSSDDQPEISEGLRVIVNKMLADGRTADQVADYLRDVLDVDDARAVIRTVFATASRPLRASAG